MSASRQKKLRTEQKAAVSETKMRQAKEDKKAARQLKVWSIIFYVAVIAIIIGLVGGGIYNSGILHRMFTAVTVGEHNLSAADLNYFYVDTVNSNTLLPYMVKADKGLDEQYQDEEKGITWADASMEQAIEQAKAIYAAYDEAMANGFTLSEESQAQIAATVNNMKTYAMLYGHSSANAMVRSTYGVGCNLKTYEEYLTVQQIANDYAVSVGEALTASEEEIAAEVKENGATYSTYDYRILDIALDEYYEGEADAEGKYTEEQTEAALAAALKAAEEKAKELKGQAETFAEDKDSILKEAVAYSSVLSYAREWLTDAERKAGDTTALENASGNGATVVMFLGSDDQSGAMPVDVRHILIEFEGEANEDGTPTDEQIATAKEKAQSILDNWKEGEATEESFGTLANENSTDTGSNTNGGLYETVYPGMMVTAFNDWCFDESRKSGDTGLVETEYGVHVMYFVGVAEDELNFRDYQAETTILNAKFEEWRTGIIEAMTAEEGFGMKMVNKNIYVNPNNAMSLS
ncbi:MAG: hypothetical protein E7459_07095 [Ruminococcaceae bacterium]|nr:hypothetical protein [Oscillospiraceae bacterium]